jgi:tetratricopeptide (TPR) repeat protein
VLALKQQDAEHYVLQESSTALSQQHKLKEAIAELERKLVLHPDDITLYSLLAQVYRSAGMGLASIRTTQLAVSRYPKSAAAHAAKAFALQHDFLARFREPGFDRAAAIAEFERALVLDPKYFGAMNDLASLYANVDVGTLTWPNSNEVNRAKRTIASGVGELRRAAALLQKAQELEDSSQSEPEITALLMRAGDYSDALEHANKLTDTKAKAIAVAFAIAMRDGGKAAVTSIDDANLAADRNSVVSEVALALMHFRNYPAMRDVFAAGDGKISDAGQRIRSNLRKTDLTALDLKQPDSIVHLHTLGLNGVNISGPNLYDPRTKEEVDALFAPFAEKYRDGQGAPGFALDMLIAMTSTQSEGDSNRGWRVLAEVSGKKTAYYVVSQKGKLLFLGSAFATVGVASYALDKIASGDVTSASVVLQWLGKDLAGDEPGGSAAVTAPQRMFAELWKKEKAEGFATTDQTFLQFAAATLLVEVDPKRASPIVAKCTLRAAANAKNCLIIQAQVASGLQQWKQVERLAKEMLKLAPDDPVAWGMALVAMVKDGRYQDASTMLQQASAPLLKSSTYPRVKMYIDLATPGIDHSAALALMENAPDTSSNDLNNVAWARLFFDATPVKAQAAAERAKAKDSRQNSNLANTLAAVAAESDDPYAAWTYWQQARQVRPLAPLTDADWYVYGRIAQCYGQRQDAIDAYRKVKRPVDADGLPSSWDFAQRGMLKLGK